MELWVATITSNGVHYLQHKIKTFL